VAVRYVELDLSSQSSVRAAASTILSLVSKIDILINNGGIMGIPYSVTPDGIESQFAVNYLSHFLLTNLLMPSILKAGPGSRVVNVSSNAYGLGGVRYEDPGFEGGKVYNPWEAYGQSKCALVLFSHALATKLKAHGGFSFSLHPGCKLNSFLLPPFPFPFFPFASYLHSPIF
jgi:NAD(P)-dependent dehydrogenase (short-subunit alcohol dehydrogenase family)